jgi:hypothetical protein
MSEGDYTPRAGRLKPLTRAQLSEMQEKLDLQRVSGSSEIRKLEELRKTEKEYWFSSLSYRDNSQSG